MPTIGRHHSGPRRTHQSVCDYCGVAYLRSGLRKNAEGFLACPDDWDGRTALEIDYQRAIDAASPTRIIPARDRPAPSSKLSELVAWGWFQGGTLERIGGGLQAAKASAGIYILTGASVTSVQAVAFDPIDPSAGPTTIPRFYAASLVNETTIKVRGRNRLGGSDDTHPGNVGTGGFLVLGYSNSGGGGVLTEIGAVWINGTTGAAITSSSDVGATISPAKTGTGVYTADIDQAYTVAEVTRFVQADIETLEAAFVWGGRTNTSRVTVRSLNNVGAAVDSDSLVRFYR